MKVLSKRFLATVLVLLMVFVLCAPAFASTTVYATTAINLRSGPGTNYSIVGALSKGQSATKIGTSGKWYKLSVNGSTVYGHKSYLSTKAPAGGSTGSGTVTGGTTSGNRQATANVNLRSGAGTKYSIVGFLPKGDTATYVSTSGKWTKVTYNGTTGYCYSKYLKEVAGSTTSTPTTGSTMVYINQLTNVFKEPSATSTPLGSLNAGQAVPFRGYQGTYAIIDYSGVLGFVPSTAISASALSTGTTSGTVTCAATAPIRSGPATSYSTIGYLYPGNVATRTGAAGDWTLITYNGLSGYVYTPSVNINYANIPSSSPAGYFHATVKTNVFDGPSTSNTVLGYMDVGQSLPYTGTIGGFVVVQYGNRTAYVLMSHTSLYNSATNMTPYNAYMYSRYSNVKVYTSPIENDTYRTGYLQLYEAVYCTAIDTVWANIYVNGRSLFVPIKNLTTTYNGAASGTTYNDYLYDSYYGETRVNRNYNGETVNVAANCAGYSYPEPWRTETRFSSIPADVTGRAYRSYTNSRFGNIRVEVTLYDSTSNSAYNGVTVFLDSSDLS